jgi:hypothetical protein
MTLLVDSLHDCIVPSRSSSILFRVSHTALIVCFVKAGTFANVRENTNKNKCCAHSVAALKNFPMNRFVQVRRDSQVP